VKPTALSGPDEDDQGSTRVLPAIVAADGAKALKLDLDLTCASRIRDHSTKVPSVAQGILEVRGPTGPTNSGHFDLLRTNGRLRRHQGCEG